MEENDGTEDVFTPWPEDWNYSRHIKQLDVRSLSYIFLEKNYFCNYFSHLWIFIVQIYDGSY